MVVTKLLRRWHKIFSLSVSCRKEKLHDCVVSLLRKFGDRWFRRLVSFSLCEQCLHQLGLCMRILKNKLIKGKFLDVRQDTFKNVF